MNAKKLYVSALEGVGRYAAGMLAAAGCLFLLAGCGGVGPEERAYPLTIFIDAVPEGYQVIYDMADLSEMTGQNKQGDGGENGGDTGTVYTAGTLDEILKIYDRECVIMRRERRKIKHIKMDLARSYSGMEAKVDNRAKEVFMRKPYSVVHTFSARQG